MHINKRSKGNSEQRLVKWSKQHPLIRRPPTRGPGQGPIRTDANGIDRQKRYNTWGKR